MKTYQITDTCDPVSFVNLADWTDLGSNVPALVDENDFIIVNLSRSEPELCRLILEKISSSFKVSHSVMFTFCEEAHQFETRSFISNNMSSSLSRCQVMPLYFSVKKPKIANNVVENLVHGLLFGKFIAVDTPLMRIYSDMASMVDVVQSICRPHGKVAMISDASSSLYRVHNSEIIHRVSYYGTAEIITSFQKTLSEEKYLSSPISALPENVEVDGSAEECELASSKSVDGVFDGIKMANDLSSTSPIKCFPGLTSTPIKCCSEKSNSFYNISSQDSAYGSQEGAMSSLMIHTPGS